MCYRALLLIKIFSPFQLYVQKSKEVGLAGKLVNLFYVEPKPALWDDSWFLVYGFVLCITADFVPTAILLPHKKSR
jgi:hypothetical protein